MRRLTLVLALAMLAAAGVVASADASVTRKKAMWGPLDWNGLPQMPVYADLGVGIWQTTLLWHDVARTRPADPHEPGDPAYVWPSSIDRAIEEGRRYGIEVMVLLMGAPPWANGGREWRHAPERPRDFADFAEAASRRYPGVRHWMIWGEPSKASNFQPMDPDNGRPLRGRRLRGPRLYARILDASYASLHRVSSRNLVIGGNTYTVGTVAPLRFIRALRLPSGRPPRMDLWGHNPFSVRAPNLRRRPLGNGHADFSDLDRLAHVLDRNFRRARVSVQRRVRIFISEFSLPTDHPNHEFNFHVSRKTQADWIRRALRIVRRWKRLYTFGYLGLYDQEPRPGGDQVDWGLIEHDGTRKPAFDAYKRG